MANFLNRMETWWNFKIQFLSNCRYVYDNLAAFPKNNKNNKLLVRSLHFSREIAICMVFGKHVFKVT